MALKDDVEQLRTSFRDALAALEDSEDSHATEKSAAEEEHLEALTIIHTADNILDDVADLRWVLFNTHEFRFL